MKSLYDPSDERDACGVGFVARLSGVPSHQVIADALTAMARLAHRGGHGQGENSGDGAGLLMPLPKAFFKRKWSALQGANDEIPFAVGQIFMPQDVSTHTPIGKIIRECLQQSKLVLEDERDVPIDTEILVDSARATMPHMLQILVRPTKELVKLAPEKACGDGFERTLYLARRRMEKAVQEWLFAQNMDINNFYVVSLSARSIIYKGMLPGSCLGDLYQDLVDTTFTAPFAIFHERFSTNTLPSWRLAQPFRNIAHNGEINTIRCNASRMLRRQPQMSSKLFGDELQDLFPIIDTTASDSARLDNALELLVRCGYSMEHALMMLIPEPFGPTFVMGDNKRAFYEYHAALMDPWDGPTALVFTDGHSRVGAMLDRNGLRPCRSTISQDGMVVLASESGVMDVEPERIVQRQQLRPRRMLMLDVNSGRLISDAEIKGSVVREKPYRRWLNEHGIVLADLMHDEGERNQEIPSPPTDLKRLHSLFDYTPNLIRNVLLPMARDSQEPVGAMGHDVPLAVLSTEPKKLFDYFKQQFSQVTNPPIDPLREELSMSLMNFAGRERNILEPEPENCAILRLPHPFLDRNEMMHLRMSTRKEVQVHTLDACFDICDDVPQEMQSHTAQMKSSTNEDFSVKLRKKLEQGLTALFDAAEKAVEQGATILIISDMQAHEKRAPIPSLLALSALHHHLRRVQKRHLCGLMVETGEACEVMHMVLLSAYGASGICPYAALDTVKELAEKGKLAHVSPYQAQVNYIAALKKGLLKAFARLGISTQRSFRSGHYFEVMGIAEDVVEKYFHGTASRLGGIHLGHMAEDALLRHAQAYAQENNTHSPAKEVRLWSKEAVRHLHKAVRQNDADAYAAYALTSDVQQNPITLRSLFSLKKSSAPKSLSLDDVEASSEIVKRFVGAAMSFGSISRAAHESIAIACNAIGARSNCGEGGEDPRRNVPNAKGEDARSRVRQIASGRFGVTAEYLAHADEIQIKMAQGAKPGEGGQLPARKVTEDIAGVRGTTPGVTLISPPPHHDIYSIEDLAQLIFDLRHIQPSASISVKLVAELGVGTVAVGVAKAGADQILISGHDGGTGASPLSAIQHTGLPWEMGLLETHQALIASGLRHKVKLRTDGQIHSGRDMLMAFMLGAEECSVGAALLVSLGCIMCRACYKGKCPVGISTQDPVFLSKFVGKPEHIQRLLFFMAEDLRKHMASLGIATVQELIGRADLLEMRTENVTERIKTLQLDHFFQDTSKGLVPWKKDVHNQEDISPLDAAIMERAAPLLAGKPVRAVYNGTVINTDRAVGTRLAGEIVRKLKKRRLPQHSYTINLWGSAGQSLGAFLPSGVTIAVHGDANDYVGKGLSGGIVIVKPARKSTFVSAEQAIVGNVALYGATSGEAYFCGTAGERFAVRNSGAMAVVEGMGDHGCEYMTGGVVGVLGECSYNFAAGMSGGMAFVYDKDERFQNRCNTQSVDMESVKSPEDCNLLRALIEQHNHYTGSKRAEELLKNWNASLPLFVKVMPLDYKNVLARQQENIKHHQETLSATEEMYMIDE